NRRIHRYGCLAVCPWNKYAQITREASLRARQELKAPGLDELVQLDDAAFREIFAGSPVKRTGRKRFVRNVLIAIGNSARRDWVSLVEERLSDSSPLVRGAAVWALWRLNPDRWRVLKDRTLTQETDEYVRSEWALA
ncbi:MAG: tRNA epoxyqueuosine(34) reductase QueG, partial [Pseudomonadota bacterium]